MARIHHTAICSRDVDASLRFWRDGLGLAEIMDLSFDGDWPTLFGAATSRLRSIFLGEPGDFESGIIELVAFDGVDDGVTDPPEAGASGPPASGFFLVSLHADLDVVLARLAALGVGGEPSMIEVSGVRLAVVTDPDGVKVELMDQQARTNLESMPPSRP